VASGQDRVRCDRRRALRVPARRALARMLAGVAVLTMTGCGTAGSGSAVAPAPMSVSSEAFVQGALASRYTCHGDKINPPLNWSAAPPGTKSLALIVDDSSAPITPFIYWLVFDIGPGTTDIQEGSKLPPGARQAQNSQGTATYDAPCPSGHPHAYRFTVYALRTVLKQANGASLGSVLSSIEAATIGRGRIVVTGSP
jgi:Raf kinase inhibitor-like YbhB/YbcL family protein